MPEKLVGANGEVGVEKDFQGGGVLWQSNSGGDGKIYSDINNLWRGLAMKRSVFCR